jgi:hypothetical protein
MTLQNLSPRTVKTYLYHIRKFKDYFKGNVEGLKKDDLRDYLYHVTTRSMKQVDFIHFYCYIYA